MLQHLGRLLRGFRLRDLVWLCRFDELLSHIYCVEDDLSAAYHPESSDVPWPVVLALGSHSKKFVFQPREIKLAKINSNLDDFKNRLKWSIVLKGIGATEPRLIKSRVTECLQAVPAPAVAALVSFVTNFVKSRAAEFPAKVICCPRYIMWAKRWLLSQKMMAIPSDKDGVFTILSSEQLRRLAYQQFEKPFYRPFGTLNMEGLVQSARSAILGCSRPLDRIHSGWANQVRASASGVSESTLKCTALATVKTHKSPISARIIHSSVMNCMNTLSAVVNNILVPRLRVAVGLLGNRGCNSAAQGFSDRQSLHAVEIRCG